MGVMDNFVVFLKDISFSYFIFIPSYLYFESLQFVIIIASPA